MSVIQGAVRPSTQAVEAATLYTPSPWPAPSHSPRRTDPLPPPSRLTTTTWTWSARRRPTPRRGAAPPVRHSRAPPPASRCTRTSRVGTRPIAVASTTNQAAHSRGSREERGSSYPRMSRPLQSLDQWKLVRLSDFHICEIILLAVVMEMWQYRYLIKCSIQKNWLTVTESLLTEYYKGHSCLLGNLYVLFVWAIVHNRRTVNHIAYNRSDNAVCKDFI